MGDQVDHAVVESQAVDVLVHEREVLVVDGLHVADDVGELARVLDEDRVVIDLKGAKVDTWAKT